MTPIIMLCNVWLIPKFVWILIIKILFVFISQIVILTLLMTVTLSAIALRINALLFKTLNISALTFQIKTLIESLSCKIRSTAMLQTQGLLNVVLTNTVKILIMENAFLLIPLILLEGVLPIIFVYKKVNSRESMIAFIRNIV